MLDTQPLCLPRCLCLTVTALLAPHAQPLRLYVIVDSDCTSQLQPLFHKTVRSYGSSLRVRNYDLMFHRSRNEWKVDSIIKHNDYRNNLGLTCDTEPKVYCSQVYNGYTGSDKKGRAN